MGINGRGWHQQLTEQHTTKCARVCRLDTEWFGAPAFGSLNFDACVSRCRRRPHYEHNLQIVPVTPSERVRLRVVNAASLYSFRFSVDMHKLLVVQSDGADIEATLVDAIVVS